jgi:hypothetical protein
MMLKRTILVSVLILAAAVLPACGDKETPEQRVERIRYNHEIYPVATKTLYSADGEPTLLVDLEVANRGSDVIENLTVLIQVFGPDGEQTDSQRVTLDLSEIPRGTGMRVSATLPGVELLEGQEVRVELEHGLPPEVLHDFPEYAEVAGVS